MSADPLSMIHPVGIDLGTTNSAVAILAATGQTGMVLNEWNETLTPSYVWFDDEAIVVGREARKAFAYANRNVAALAKREMGNATFSQPMRNRSLPPEVIQAYILRQLRLDIERRLTGTYQVAVTVPAYFDELRRQRTIDAATMAGLPVIAIVNEPTAAALAYAERLGFLTSTGGLDRSMSVLVYDLGGGTFDVTLIDLQPHSIQTLATDGDVYLGGYDWDRRLRDYVSQKFEDRFRVDPRNDPEFKMRMTYACEEAKQTLTTRRHTTLSIDSAGQHLELEITRDTFEYLTADLVERTLHTTRQVLRAAGRSWPEVDRVLLVGGATRMPMIIDRIRAESGIEPDMTVNPDEAVARGAALFAAEQILKRGDLAPAIQLRVVDVSSHSLGVEGIDQVTGRKQNTILIPKNSPLPAEVCHCFVTKEDNQRSVVVNILEGESSEIDACIPIGKAVLRDLPPNLPQGCPVQVTCRYAADGRLQVRAKLVGRPHEVQAEFRRDGSLDDRRLRQWRHIVCGSTNGSELEQMLEDAFG